MTASSQSDLPASVSLVIPTLGRLAPLERVLASLAAQTRLPLEVIVVDQNDADLLAPLCAEGRWPFPLKRLRTPGERGASRARNAGWRLALGELVLFPDDDAWYPADFLAKGVALFAATGADLLTGRSVDEAGRSINARFHASAGPITPSSVWVMQQEWLTLIRRDWLQRLGGYEESIGVGAASPWQAAEGPDLILRALRAGAVCRYEPDWVGMHEELDVYRPDDRMIAKCRAYARGMGHVLRRHRASPLVVGYWAARAAANAAVNAALGRRRRAWLLALVAVGRLEGGIGRLLPPASPASFEGDSPQ